jgi:hypothetical protein
VKVGSDGCRANEARLAARPQRWGAVLGDALLRSAIDSFLTMMIVSLRKCQPFPILSGSMMPFVKSSVVRHESAYRLRPRRVRTKQRHITMGRPINNPRLWFTDFLVIFSVKACL